MSGRTIFGLSAGRYPDFVQFGFNSTVEPKIGAAYETQRRNPARMRGFWLKFDLN